MANPFVHIELNTDDPGKAREFYAALFDWKLEAAPGMDYTMINVGEGTGGGIMQNPAESMGVPSHWMAYIGVDDIRASTEKAKSLGEDVLHGPQEIPQMGWFTVLKDPTGAVFAIWQNATPCPDD